MATPRDSSPPVSSGGDTIEDDVRQPVTENEREDLPKRTPTTKSTRGRRSVGTSGRGRKKNWLSEGLQEGTEDEGSVTSVGRTIGTAVGFRRQANGTVGSVYSGSKVRHIKKEDGTPLWRKEIQYEFLKLVIDDDKPVFTRYSDGKKDCSFADIYIDCLVQSSKTSKILKDRLQVDRQAAKNMAMICLLVNVGRMNTTLNFFPEMRAQLRTYHSIPSLQAYKSQRDYKSLQDAPRLKSILKGASEDDEHPRAVQQLPELPIPRTNAVNLIFIISQFAPRISEEHLLDKVDFFDLTMRSTISSKSRARAFLWLMWWYLESNFNKEDALNNPFGPGQFRPDQKPDDSPEAAPFSGTLPTIVPDLEHITEEEGDAENFDTPEEVDFAERMTKERKRIMEQVANEPPLTMADPENKSVKRLKRSAGIYGTEDDSLMMSDVDSRASPGLGRSPAPGEHIMNTALGAQADSIDDDFEQHDPHPGRGRYKRVRGKNTPSRAKGMLPGPLAGRKRAAATPEFRSTPQPLARNAGATMSQYDVQRGGDPNGFGYIPSKPRARTGYQRELEEHKQKRIEWALRRRRKEAMARAKNVRLHSNRILRAARRIQDLEATYDSEDEDDLADGGVMPIASHSRGVGGVTGRIRLDGVVGPDDELDDYGEEAESWLRATLRIRRRLEVWDGEQDLAVYDASLGGILGPQRGKLLSGGVESLNGGHGHEVSDMEWAAEGRPLQLQLQPRTKKEMDAQIEMDLLAERSGDEDVTGTPLDDAEGNGEGDVEGDADADGIEGDDDENGDADAEGDAAESDVPMD
jgi:Ino eighty subunit 1